MFSSLPSPPTVALRRLATIGATILLSHAAIGGTPTTLSDLELESGSGLVGFSQLALSPSFSSSQLSYAANIPFEHSEVNVVLAASSDPFNDVEVTIPESFPPGQTRTITIVVSDDPFFPTQSTTYTVGITRGAPNATASLSNLVASGVPISPVFDPLTFTYTATVGHGTDSITVTPTAADLDSTITVDGELVASASPSPPIELATGVTQVVILVTSADESVTKGYEVLVNRLEQDSDGDLMEDFWEFENGLEIGVDDGLLDKDHDGQQNLFEYAFGSDPCDPLDTSNPQLAIDGSGFAVLSFFKAVTDGSLTYTPEVATPGPNPVWSSDLTDQTPGGEPQNQAWRDNAGGTGTPPAQRWLRVRIGPAS